MSPQKQQWGKQDLKKELFWDNILKAKKVEFENIAHNKDQPQAIVLAAVSTYLN